MGKRAPGIHVDKAPEEMRGRESHDWEMCAELQSEGSRPGQQALSAMLSIWSHSENNGQILKGLKKEMTPLT